MSSGLQCSSTRSPTASGTATGTWTVKVSPGSTAETMLARLKPPWKTRSLTVPAPVARGRRSPGSRCSRTGWRRPRRRSSRAPSPDAAGAGDHAARNDRALAHEGRGEAGAGSSVDPFGRARVLDPPVARDHAQIGQRHGLLLVVGDVDEGGADALLDGLQLVLHLAPELEVERAERLVEQQHRRLDHERAGEAPRADAGRRKLVRPAPRDMLQPDQRQRILDGAAALGARDALHQQPEADVAADAHVGKQRVILKRRWPSGAGQGVVVQSTPAIRTRPALGARKPPRIDNNVVLPDGRAEQHGVARRRDLERDVAQRLDRAEAVGDGLDSTTGSVTSALSRARRARG